MPADAFEFVEAADIQDLSPIVKKLKGIRGKDALLKVLKPLSAFLEKSPQDVGFLGSHGKDVTDFLVDKGTLEHADEDVKLYVAHCLASLLRIHAPESPYKEETYERVYDLILWAIQRLANGKVPTYDLSLAILQCVKEASSYIPLLDLEREPMEVEEVVCKFMRGLLESLSEGNQGDTQILVRDILETIMAEADPREKYVDLLLSFVVAPKRQDNPVAFRVVRDLLKNSEQQLKPLLQKYLTTLLVDPHYPSSVRGKAYEVVYQVYCSCPDVLLPILPHLARELQSEDEGRRLETVHLLGDLFSLPGGALVVEYRDLLEEMLRRAQDHKVEVRLAVMKHVRRLVAAAGSSELQQKILSRACERLQDYDEKVRAAAVAALCDSAADDIRVVPPSTLSRDVTLRLWDTRPAVRKSTANSLVTLFREYCQYLHNEGHLPQATESQVMWVPGKVSHACWADLELRTYFIDHLLGTHGLLPPSLPPLAGAQCWVLVWEHTEKLEKEALLKLMASKQTLQHNFLWFLGLCQSGKSAEDQEGNAAGAEKRLVRVLKEVARHLPDPAKVEESLQKLRQSKDKKIIANLLTACSYGVSNEVIAKNKKDVQQRVGSKTPVADVISLIVNRLQVPWVTVEQMESLLDLLMDHVPQLQASPGPSSPPGQDPGLYKRMCRELLTAIAKSTPGLFIPLVPRLTELVQHEDKELVTLATQLLASFRRLARSTCRAVKVTSITVNCLISICQSGPPKAAKCAAITLVNFLEGTQQEGRLDKLCGELAAQLDPDKALEDDVPAVLNALSSLGRMMPGVFSAHAQRMMTFVVDHYLSVMGPVDWAMSTEDQLWGDPTPLVARKLAAIKAMARALTLDDMKVRSPEEYSHVAQQYMVVLHALVDPACEWEWVTQASEVDQGHTRLAAFSALMRLARRHDAKMQPLTYTELGLAMQDTLLEMRASVATKVRRLVMFFQTIPGSHQVSAKYAAFLPLAAMDPSQDNKDRAYGYLREFVNMRRQHTHQLLNLTASSSSPSSGGTMMQEMPEIMLPYLVYLLAHHPDFPEDDDEGGVDLAMFDPFQYMLQFAIEPLLAPGAGGVEACSMAPAILKTFRYLKRTEDTLEVGPANDQIRCLCEIGREVTLALVAQYEGAAKTEDPKADYPGHVILPKNFYRALSPAEQSGLGKEGSHLPPGFQVHLDPNPSSTRVKGFRASGSGAAPRAGPSPVGLRKSGGSGGGTRKRQRGESKSSPLVERESGRLREGSKGGPQAEVAAEEGSPKKKRKAAAEGDRGQGSKARRFAGEGDSRDVAEGPSRGKAMAKRKGANMGAGKKPKKGKAQAKKKYGSDSDGDVEDDEDSWENEKKAALAGAQYANGISAGIEGSSPTTTHQQDVQRRGGLRSIRGGAGAQRAPSGDKVVLGQQVKEPGGRAGTAKVEGTSNREDDMNVQKVPSNGTGEKPLRSTSKRGAEGAAGNGEKQLGNKKRQESTKGTPTKSSLSGAKVHDHEEPLVPLTRVMGDDKKRSKVREERTQDDKQGMKTGKKENLAVEERNVSRKGGRREPQIQERPPTRTSPRKKGKK